MIAGGGVFGASGPGTPKITFTNRASADRDVGLGDVPVDRSDDTPSDVTADLENEKRLHELQARLRCDRGPLDIDAETETVLRRLLGPPDG